MSDAPLVLVVEDDPQMLRLLTVLLEGNGLRVVSAKNAAEAETMAATYGPEVIILDLGLPDRDGLELTRKLREWTSIPIVVVSARGREGDKVQALDHGADDYLTKPFGSRELLARIRVALRHARAGSLTTDPTIRIGELEIDMSRRRVARGDVEISLTPLEFKLLALLAKHAGKVLSHQQILAEVWGKANVAHTHYVRVYMAQLRRKIETDPARPRYLLTEMGVGYRMADEPTPPEGRQ